jgi:hypothetical protein
MLTAQSVKCAILSWPCLYETEGGFKFLGETVSGIPARLRENGWRNVSGLSKRDLEELGLKIVTARYIGGARKKRFCDVVVAGLQWDFRKGK